VVTGRAIWGGRPAPLLGPVGCAGWAMPAPEQMTADAKKAAATLVRKSMKFPDVRHYRMLIKLGKRKGSGNGPKTHQ
jgi:hypothetical protein